MVSLWRRFDLLVAAMPQKILDQIMNVLENLPEICPYYTLKALLLEIRTLSDQEMIDIPFKSESLDGPKPSQMLPNMLAYCPSGMEQLIMFQYTFL